MKSSTCLWYDPHMWLFTNFGFFSIVQKGTPDRLTIRGRSRQDLETLVRRYGSLLGVGPEAIVDSPAGDYCCRVGVDKADFSAAMAAIAADIDYSNFKDSVHQEQGHDRAHIYMDVWSTMYEFQLSQGKKLQRAANLYSGLPSK